MKKLLIFILSIVLVGCVDANVIEVKHSDDFTSELIAEIELDNQDSVYSVNRCDLKKICINEYYQNKIDKTYELDLTTNEITEIDHEYNSEEVVTKVFTNLLYDNEFKIYSENVHEDHYIYKKYYYEKDGIKTKLIDYTINMKEPSGNYLYSDYLFTDNDFYFLLPKDSYLVIYQVKDALLEEVDKILIQDGEYTLSNVSIEENGLSYKYESENAFRFVLGDEEFVLLKNDNGKELIEYYIDGLTPKQLTYRENGNITLHLEDKVYKLGYNAKYQIRDDYILSTSWKEDFTEKETILIDRNKNKTYLLSESFDVQETYLYNRNLYLTKNLNNKETPYSILMIDNLDITAIDLPFTIDFESVYFYEDTIIFKYQENGIVQFYKVKF